MPPTPGAEWAVARFKLDEMYSNDSHTKVLAPNQQYERLTFVLNGDLKPESVIELDWVVAWRGKDAEAPGAPTGFTVAREGETMRFAWRAAADNLQVSHYELLRKDGAEWKAFTLATGCAARLPAAGLGEGPFAIRALDAAGNASEAVEPAAP